MCRGNFRSSWVASGGYDHVAEALFGDLAVDGFFLEYDDARSGGFEPLRFVPKGKMVVLGLVTTKKGALESKDDAEAPHRRGGKICALRATLPQPAMWLFIDRRGQRAHHRRGNRQAVPRRRHRPRCLGLINQASITWRSRGCEPVIKSRWSIFVSKDIYSAAIMKPPSLLPILTVTLLLAATAGPLPRSAYADEGQPTLKSLLDGDGGLRIVDRPLDRSGAHQDV